MTVARAALLADLALAHGTFVDEETGTEWTIKTLRSGIVNLTVKGEHSLTAEERDALEEGIFSNSRWYNRCGRVFLGSPE